jgi:hypothetical protein
MGAKRRLMDGGSTSPLMAAEINTAVEGGRRVT